MDDVDGHAGGLGQADHAVRRLALEDGLAGDAVVVRVGLAGRHEVGRDHVDGRAVLGVHHDQPAVLRGLLHRPEDRAVVAVEDARVGREELEVGHALVDQPVHLGEGRVVHVRHDHVEAVVDDGVALGLGVPRVQALAQRVAPRLDREIDDRRGPAEGRGPGPGLERVLGERPAERQLHVGVDVDGAGMTQRPVRRSSRRASPSRPVRDRPRRSSRRRRGRRPVRPSAVTTVPFAISVRMAPPPVQGSVGDGLRVDADTLPISKPRPA